VLAVDRSDGAVLRNVWVASVAGFGAVRVGASSTGGGAVGGSPGRDRVVGGGGGGGAAGRHDPASATHSHNARRSHARGGTTARPTVTRTHRGGAAKGVRPAKPIDSRGVAGVTAAEQARAENLLGATCSSVAAVADNTRLEDGYFSWRRHDRQRAINKLEVHRRKSLLPGLRSPLVYDTAACRLTKPARRDVHSRLEGHVQERSGRRRKADAWHLQ